MLNDESGNATQLGRETFRIKKENHQLIEENNLLKLKIDILLDMVWYYLGLDCYYPYVQVYIIQLIL